MIKIMINVRGHLNISRHGVIVLVKCPEQTKHEYCGDWCALFTEPEVIRLKSSDTDAYLSLTLCRTIHKCKESEFQDLRESGEE